MPEAGGRSDDPPRAAASALSPRAFVLVLAYALGRFAGTGFDNLRNIIFERVGQEATRALAEDVFQRLHSCRCASTWPAAPAK
jgi:ATP-binding cassette subfamily B protein